ncbi:MAG: RluA family pseudouridine synthase [Variibacter sp.]
MSDAHERIDTVIVPPDGGGQRLDKTLATLLPELSRSRLKALILDGMVASNGRPCRDPSEAVAGGAAFAVTIPPAAPAEPEGEDIPLDVVHEDDALIVIDKPAGLVVHPAAGNWTGTLVNALIAHCGASLSGVGGVRRPGIVHRLDKDTTGLMVVAKTDAAHKSLSAQFADHGRTGSLQRGYRAFVWGALDRPRGTVDAPLGRHPQARDKQAIRRDGREAITHWERLETYRGKGDGIVASQIACTLETGRTHQIRVHMAHVGHPLLGDDLYGRGFKTKAEHLYGRGRLALQMLGRQALHAYLLGFDHPSTRQYVEFRSELPADLARLRGALATEGE